MFVLCVTRCVYLLLYHLFSKLWFEKESLLEEDWADLIWFRKTGEAFGGGRRCTTNESPLRLDSSVN